MIKLFGCEVEYLITSQPNNLCDNERQYCWGLIHNRSNGDKFFVMFKLWLTFAAS